MPDDVMTEAPGRVNLIGEHTDYHDGLVLPMTIPQRTRVHIRRRPGGLIRVRSALLADAWEDYEPGAERPGRGWLDYVQGVTWVLSRHGIDVPGADIAIDSDVPAGAGVSSSAALEISLLRGFRLMLGLDADDVQLARFAHTVETDFVGAPVGIMDQMVCSVGRDGEAVFLDTRSLDLEHIPLPATIEFLVVHSGITHAHAGGDYVTRRRESFEAAALLGVDRLRDVTAAALVDGVLPPLLARRARHVVTENWRVMQAVAALRTGDGVRLGALFSASHASMRDDYEISTPEIDMLVRLAHAHPDVHGARLTGGGFGGAVVVLTRTGASAGVAAAILPKYQHVTGKRAELLVPASA
jgi:galactokinase